MMAFTRLFAAAALADLAAFAFYPALRLSHWPRTIALLAAYVPILYSPLLVPAEQPVIRFFAGLVAVVLFTKLYDLYIGAGLGHKPTLRAYAGFLINLCSGALRKEADQPLRSARENFLHLVLGSARAAFGVAVLFPTFRHDWSAWPFLAENAIKVSFFYAMLVPATVAGTAFMQLAGWRAREHFDHPYLARTPAEFWRRYNRPAAQFLYEDFFKPAGGLRSPVRATLVTFFVSALIHEYLFDIAASEVQGYQMAFFMIQGLASAATLRVKPTGWRAVPWVVGTLALNLITSALFFASVNAMVPFYCRRGAVP
jgi:hypothetical protein